MFCSNCGKEGHLAGKCPKVIRRISGLREFKPPPGWAEEHCSVCKANREKEKLRKRKYRERKKS